jgi:hypothetical protein
VKRVDPAPLIARALDVAEKHLGIEELCHRLVVPEAEIRAWRFGHAAMPEYKFLRLVDILTELDPSWVDWDEAQPK